MDDQRSPVEPEVSPGRMSVEPGTANRTVEPAVTPARGQVKPDEEPPENPGERVSWGIKVIRAGHRWNARQASKRAELRLERGEVKVIPTMTAGEIMPPARTSGLVRVDQAEKPSVAEIGAIYDMMARMAKNRGCAIAPKAERMMLHAAAESTGIVLPRTLFRHPKSSGVALKHGKPGQGDV
jgi:hypothetical protein